MQAADVILIFLVFVGVVGAFVPAMPGTGFVFLGALIHGLMTDFEPLTVKVLLLLGVMALAAWAGQYVITALGSKKFGSTKYGVVGAFVGLMAGLLLPIPGGVFLGSFLGAFLGEIIFAMKDMQEALKAGFGALVGLLFSLFFEFFVALAMAAVLVIRLAG